MEDNTKIWREYYEQSISRPHLRRTELAVKLNQSRTRVAVDCGCGTGSDIQYLAQQGYQVHGFDVNADAAALCKARFAENVLVEIEQAAFESFDYPKAGIVIANSSLFFANPDQFQETWHKIEACLEAGGVFAGDFMGEKDSWANNYRSPTTPLTESHVTSLFTHFDVVRFFERDESAKTALGRMKHWHTYSVVAVKRALP
ncbi:class I SAM-dependent methyltransferase [Vibrio fluvialis]|uniref:class I SAM-dependent methyltransferase n=1 Tax=Vibrio fluvialis TaxID=676 RepID=UPI0003571D8A|nr:class I SAM-dependent methyltransferase [Vibrio fluvialis]EPP27932.1 SAM-dependent methyltransferase [Vibrio fluvialis I21563]MBL4241190.1 class I SAM-dependent methyltransferase [Vibrio fluvialis]MBL4250141.1 class I SAM-dependent methyltransferase [Vibrio fluvialis]MBL4276937.1 class I SAM-dependent methyltransferase [Vibrio fluvialis]MBY8113469.1 class I SAM-dependent methyltransferase [Vibrio fluvialis]